MPEHWYRLPAGSTFTITADDDSPLLATAGDMVRNELIGAGLVPALRPGGHELAITLEVLAGEDERRRFRGDYGLTVPLQPESYAIAVRQCGRHLLTAIAGSDAAGVLYGVGRFLRACGKASGVLAVPAALNLSAHPWHPPVGGEPAMRGQQLTTQFCHALLGDRRLEDCVRELAVWGNNWLWLSMGSDLAHAGSCREAVARAQQHATMLNEVARLAARYGMKFGLHVCGQRIDPTDVRPGMVRDGHLCPSVPQARAAVLRALEAAYDRLERLDGVFTASGDPGGCRCDDCRPWPITYLAMAAEQAALLRRQHPAARYYLSNQQMQAEENDLFLELLAKDQPDWLTGVLWGPQSRSLAEMRERIPERYQVILYPDNTHAAVCQHPVAGWEKERALLFERRSPTYRPLATRQLWEATKRYAQGSKPYSEGVYDDLNKALWSGSQWCVTTPGATIPLVGPEAVGEIVHQYARRYFGLEAGEVVAEIMFALEENWSTPLLGNPLVPAVLEALGELEHTLPAERRESWRWQMLVMRAELDRWLQLKVAGDRQAEARALAALAMPGEPRDRVRAARRRLAGFRGGREQQRLAASIVTRSARLRELIALDLRAPARLDRNYANREWLLGRLAEIAQAPRERQEALIAQVIRYEDPGEGGWYDNCGNVTAEPHLAQGEDYMHDDFEAGHRLSAEVMSYGRMEWDADVVYCYDGLDPAARYQVEVTYLTNRRMPSTQVLYAGGIEVHGPLTLPTTPTRYTFDLPTESYATGYLELRFRRVEGRGVLVSEIWVRRTG